MATRQVVARLFPSGRQRMYSATRRAAHGLSLTEHPKPVSVLGQNQGLREGNDLAVQGLVSQGVVEGTSCSLHMDSPRLHGRKLSLSESTWNPYLFLVVLLEMTPNLGSSLVEFRIIALTLFLLVACSGLAFSGCRHLRDGCRLHVQRSA